MINIEVIKWTRFVLADKETYPAENELLLVFFEDGRAITCKYAEMMGEPVWFMLGSAVAPCKDGDWWAVAPRPEGCPQLKWKR